MVPVGSDNILDLETTDLFEEAKEKLILKFQHMYRSANRVAHVIAHHASGLANCILWISDFPPWLVDLAKLDI